MALKRFPHRPDFLDFKANPELDAYFLGFFYADGYNNEKRGSIRIRLSGRDELFLQMLSDSIYIIPKKVYEILAQVNGETRRFVDMDIYSRDLSQRLKDLGAMQAKTFRLTWPTFLTSELERHFIRGYFDGDGSCLHMARNNTHLDRAIHFPGTLALLTGLKDAIERYTGLTSGIIPFGNIHLLHLGGNRKTLTFMEWLYKDATYYLQRKHDRYLLLKKDMQEIDDGRTYIMHDKKKEMWAGRLPNRYERVGTGYAYTYEEALAKWQIAMQAIKDTSFEEWMSNRPPQRKRGPTREHVKEQGIAEGRYLRENKAVT